MLWQEWEAGTKRDLELHDAVRATGGLPRDKVSLTDFSDAVVENLMNEFDMMAHMGLERA